MAALQPFPSPPATRFCGTVSCNDLAAIKWTHEGNVRHAPQGGIDDWGLGDASTVDRGRRDRMIGAMGSELIPTACRARRCPQHWRTECPHPPRCPASGRRC